MSRTDIYKQHTYTPNDFYAYLRTLEQLVEGDVDLNIIPAEADAAEVAEADMDGYEQEITVQVVDGDGNVLTGYNGTLNVQVNVDSTNGTAQINDEDPGGAGTDVDEDLPFEQGELTFKVTYGGSWSETDSDKAEITVDKDDKNIAGYAVKEANHKVLEVVA